MIGELWPWLRAAGRKALYRWTERGALKRLTGPLSRKSSSCRLQIHSIRKSAALRVSARWRIHPHRVASFAAHAPGDAVLVIKHHPMDRGYHNYQRLIQTLAADFALGSRLLYIHDQHLPTLSSTCAARSLSTAQSDSLP